MVFRLATLDSPSHPLDEKYGHTGILHTIPVSSRSQSS